MKRKKVWMAETLAILIDQIDDAVLDVEDALDELKSLFAQLKDESGAGDMGGDDEMAMDMGPEEETEESFQFEDADELDESADLIAVCKASWWRQR